MTTKRTRVAVLGAGRLGATMSVLLRSGFADVKLWARSSSTRKAIAPRMKQFGVECCARIEDAVEGAELIVIAVPGQSFAEVVADFGPVARGDQVVLHATRGVGDDFVLPHELLRQGTCIRKIGVLGGPLYASTSSDKRPVFVALASRYDEVWDLVRDTTQGTVARVHYGRDIIGTEVAGIYTLVTALVVGMADALDFDETAKGVLLAHGLSDATKLGIFLGGDLSTFTGLAGLGDLIPRDVSSTQRHYAYAAGLVAGVSPEELAKKIDGHVEGVDTIRHASRLLDGWGLELSMMDCMRKVLAGDGKPAMLIEDILNRDLRVGSEVRVRPGSLHA